MQVIIQSLKWLLRGVSCEVWITQSWVSLAKSFCVPELSADLKLCLLMMFFGGASFQQAVLCCAGQEVSWDHQRFSLLPRDLTSLQIMKCSYRSKAAAREECLIVLSTAFMSFLSRRFVQSFQGCHHTELLLCFTGSLSDCKNSYDKPVNRTPVLISKQPPALLHTFCFLSFIWLK